MNMFTVHFSDLTQFARDRIADMSVIHYGDLIPSAQDRFCTWFGMDVDFCFPVCNNNEIVD